MHLLNESGKVSYTDDIQRNSYNDDGAAAAEEQCEMKYDDRKIRCQGCKYLILNSTVTYFREIYLMYTLTRSSW